MKYITKEISQEAKYFTSKFFKKDAKKRRIRKELERALKE